MPHALRPGTFTAFIPYYNEADFLPDTLRSWLAQTRRPDVLMLVDNGSTDDSTALARQVLEGVDDIDVVWLEETRPGKIHALETGEKHLTTEFIALCDADTYYPPHYLETCERLFAEHEDDVVALLACDVYEPVDSLRSRWRRLRLPILHAFMPKKVFSGGYGHVMRVEALRRAGGFSERNWPFVLLDHEIFQRLYKVGKARYHMDLWCITSPRRANRGRVRWTLPERLLYTFLPHRFSDWFWYRFLARRMARRKLDHVNLREKPWQSE